jgi:hypothetical protein
MVGEGAICNYVGQEDIRFIERNASKLLGTTFNDEIDQWCREIIANGRESRAFLRRKIREVSRGVQRGIET